MYPLRLVICLTIVIFCEGNLASWDTAAFRINSFVINSTESLRFATVNITTVIENIATEDKELRFEIQIPKSAFISGFTMRVGDKEMKAYVTDKDAAREIYDDAKEQNITAGHVTQQSSVADDKDRDIFRISVNIAEQTTAELKLQYQEFLERHAGVYKQKFYIFPRNIVTNIVVSCEFTERQLFTKFDFKVPLEDTKFARTYETKLANNYFMKRLEWKPDQTLQSIENDEDYALEVVYELEPLDNGGHVIYNDEGQFAHYFSSTCNVTNIYPKMLIFLIDVSGSMKGIAIQQVLVAMGLILDQLRQTDMFNIVLFAQRSQVYSSIFLQATPSNVLAAKTYLQNNVVANGGTDMNGGLIKSIGLFDASEESGNFAKNIVFLTDGEPTVGVTSKSRIRENLKAVNYYNQRECCKVDLFIIAFSKSAAISFLESLVYDHSGSLRVIRESMGNVISLELLDLYAEIHNPYYKSLNFTYYVGETILPDANLTQSYFLNYDCGSEIVVGGNTLPGSMIQPRVIAQGRNTITNFKSIQTARSNEVHDKTLSRLVAYKQVQEYIKVMRSSTNKTAAAVAKEKATNISLQMEFVTPVTSMVVAFYKRPDRIVGDRKFMTKGGFSGQAPSSPMFDLYELDDAAEKTPIFNSACAYRNAPKFVIRFLIFILAFAI